MRIAFAGNPNSGKTTMYNALTGRNERVGNWAGVTVEKKESAIRRSYADTAETLMAVDLPGAYSMSPFTSEESITSAYVRSEHPDVIVNIVDATNLSRSLFFTTQLLELGVPVVVALNKSDINRKKETRIDTAALSAALVAGIEVFQAFVGSLVENAHPLLQALLVDGIIGGVSAVIGFLPLVMVMYFLIALLEDCGYMARVCVVLDPIFKKAGLSGKSVIPFVIGTGCAIPGVMACRTIRSERERRAAAMLTPFMPCGAKLPVIALFAGAFFSDASWVGTLMYFVGIALIFFGALLVGRISGYKNRRSFFIMELPEYKVPSVRRAFISMCARGWAYIVKAGTIILVCNTVVQIMQTFTWSFQVAQLADTSILASVARPFAYLLVPVIGVVSWQMAAAAITGFIAKENVVGTLAVCFIGLENLIDTEELALMEGAGAEAATVFAITRAAALAYLMFNLFTPPCFAALGAMNAEIGDRKWFWGGVGLQFATGFTVAYLVYQIGTLITTGSVGAGFVPGLIAVLAIAAVIAILIRRTDRSLSGAYALGGRK